MLFVTFHKVLIFMAKFVGTPQNSQDEGPPLLACPLMFIQHIRSYRPHLETASSRYAVVTRGPCNRENILDIPKMSFDPLLPYVGYLNFIQPF
jgi:hypothetical protein